jgi:hypothetical protein
MRIAVIVIGIAGLVFFALSIYSYLTSGKHFKTYAYGFLISSVTVFILVIIRRLNEMFDIGKRKE